MEQKMIKEGKFSRLEPQVAIAECLVGTILGSSPGIISWYI